MIRAGRVRARIRWTDPATHERRSYSITVDGSEEAQAFFDLVESRTRSELDPFVTLTQYVHEIGDRYLRGLDFTSTADIYRCGIRRRVLPTLGHLPVRRITTGVIDRAIDGWERDCAASTLKNTIAALSKVLDEAVRDELIATNPARSRAKRRTLAGTARTPHRIPTLHEIEELARACSLVHRAYGDFVLLATLLAARSSEVSGLLVGDVDWDQQLVTVARQLYPGAGGLQLKPTKSRRPRSVPILEPLQPVLRRLTEARGPNKPLLRGPRGGAITTGTLCRATRWSALVRELGYPGLRRHDLRHTGATWFANAGVPLHIVSDILGHASIETTRTYLHSDNADLLRAAQEINRHIT